MLGEQRIRHIVRRLRGRRSVESLVMQLTPERSSVGRMLLSYHPEIFERLLEGKPLKRSHIGDWHGFQLARAFLDFGFDVDVIHVLNEDFLPSGHYDVMVDGLVNLGRLAGHLGPGCRKFLHPHGAHWTVNNARTYARHAALAQRRGVSLFPERAIVPNQSVERADFITCRGGEWGRRTFAFTSTPVQPIPQLTPAAIDEFIVRDVAQCRGRFVFLGGRGLVHKGLDLLLEAFAEMPDCQLTVCGDVAREPHFQAAYQRELWSLPNIRTLGYTDTLSEQFRSVCAQSIAMIIPSASELGCGSAIAGMMNGLIPVVTPSTDVDVNDIGFSITNESVEGVRDVVKLVNAQTDATLRDMSRMAWEAADARYGRQRFLTAYRMATSHALSLDPPAEWDAPLDTPLRIPKIKRTKVWNLARTQKRRVF